MKGFTLIELLVVVLIIGILSAVALPQYQKAVEKSRAAQAFVLGKHLAQAEELFYLANGRYTDDWDELGETEPVLKDWTVRLDRTVWDVLVSRKGSTLHYRFFMQYPNHDTPYAGKYLCVAKESDDKAMSICRTYGSEGEKYVHMGSDYKGFVLN